MYLRMYKKNHLIELRDTVYCLCLLADWMMSSLTETVDGMGMSCFGRPKQSTVTVQLKNKHFGYSKSTEKDGCFHEA